jgi:hypothetical protein
MSHLSRTFSGRNSWQKVALGLLQLLLLALLTGAAAAIGGCSSASGGGSGGKVNPPIPEIVVSVAPQAGTVLLGGTVSFTASVSNTSDTSVAWSVNKILGGSAQAGTISLDGVYTAPASVPQGGTVLVTATSHADSSKSGSASLSISSDIAVSVSPASANVELGSIQTFRASVSSGGNPDSTIRWSLAGAACPAACGTIDASGNFTAPQILPNPAIVTIIATSAADPSKQNSAVVTVLSDFTLQINAPASLSTGATTSIVATMTPVTGSNPSGQLSWKVSGAGCGGNACGILTVTTAQSAGGNSVADTANYTAPSNAPQPNTVVVTVTPQADPTKKVQASINIQGGAGLSISPVAATLAANHRTTLTVTEAGVSGALNWSVNSVAGGNSAVGQICAVGSNPCQNISSGTATQVDYVAPGSMPGTNPVSVVVSSANNSLLTATSQITVLNHILVSVLPNSVTLPPLGVQGFTANVLGTSNQAVVWQLQGLVCAGGLCGEITPAGAYSGPAVAPTPNTLQVIAVSQDDVTQTGTATVSISTGANILSLHPASVYAGAAEGFTLRVDGSGFTPASPGPGSLLLIGGTPRVTTCDSANSCSAPVNSADVALAGNVAVQVQSPSLTQSNVVSLVAVAPGTSESVITLGNSDPVATGVDIVVVEPTSAGLDSTLSNLDLQVAALGTYVSSTNTCNLAGSPIPLIRPSSGTIAAEICLFSQAGLDTSMSYSISGPGDIAVIAKQPAGLGIIHLTLQIPATATPGDRTLFIQNANLDRTAASGALDIQ